MHTAIFIEGQNHEPTNAIGSAFRAVDPPPRHELPAPLGESLEAAMDFLNRAYQAREIVALALAGAGPLHSPDGILRGSFAAVCENTAADLLRIAHTLRH